MTNDAAPPSAVPQRDQRLLRLAFCALILTGSFLLFLVQPLVARLVLPEFGGAPAVWNSAMLVYQCLLLAGYGYAHWLGRFALRRQALIQLALLLLAAFWLPIGIIASLRPAMVVLDPVVAVPLLLCGSIGPLFLAVAAQAPMIQRWHAQCCPGRDPYALYALSNIGSFAGLLAYPLLLEPTLGVVSQRWLWSALYLLLLAGMGGMAWRLSRLSPQTVATAWQPERPSRSKPPGWRQSARWAIIAAVPSGLMLATTSFLTTDIVAMPLLWVAPLGLYLLSFSLAFSGQRVARRAVLIAAPAALVAGCHIAVGGGGGSVLLTAAFILAMLFVVSTALHARLHALRPASEHLTRFYLLLSLGGVIGGGFTALLAPLLFDWTYEFPLLLLASLALLPRIRLPRPLHRVAQWHGVGGCAIALAGAMLFLPQIWPGALPSHAGVTIAVAVMATAATLAYRRRLAVLAIGLAAMVGAGLVERVHGSLSGDSRSRSYFGVYDVQNTPTMRLFNHGTTVHGVQRLGPPDLARMATSYYVPRSGVGRVLAAAPQLVGPKARIAVVGLGAGTLACYARPGQSWHFMEIDPLVVRIARESGQFHFLSTCTPNARISVGDARLTLQTLPGASLDMLVLDAFSSDSVPMHLLTREAFALYGHVVERKGVVLLHITNRFLDLAPSIAATVRGQGWTVMELQHKVAHPGPMEAQSRWLALSRDKAMPGRIAATDPRWTKLEAGAARPAWTDDYASILPAIRQFAP